MNDKISHDWIELRRKYVYGNTTSVKAFLEAKGIKISGFVTRKTKGWKQEKEQYLDDIEKATKEKLIEMLSDEQANVRKRQAAISRHIQEVAIRILEKQKPKNFSEALRCLKLGLEVEREALGLNNTQKAQVYVEPKILNTRFTQRLSGMNNRELIEVLEEMDGLKNRDKNNFN